MSNALSCPVCLEDYKRDFSAPYTCVPCSHNCCLPCLTQWRTSNSTCPICRTRITTTVLNRGLLDTIDINIANNVDDAIRPLSRTNSNSNNANNFFELTSNNSKKQNELIVDKCVYSVYIIDNSGSMDHYNDGKIFSTRPDGKIDKMLGVKRWDEAVSKTIQIAQYNLNRKMTSAYYLLNPNHATNWVLKKDYIIVNDIDDFTILKQVLLNSSNIRGATPLDVVTNNMKESLRTLVNSENYKHMPICYNIITDGEPTNKIAFETSIRNLSKSYCVFLVINLCTDDDAIVDYYNDLDKKIGNELSGCDVIDDFEAEAAEVISNNNLIVTYSEEIHICRMAGCYSVVSDLLDECKLPVHYVTKLCNEIMGLHNNKNLPHWSNRQEYIKQINAINNEKGLVYDIYYKKFKSRIDVKKLDYEIYFEQNKSKFYIKIQSMFYHNKSLYLYVLVFVVFLYFIYTNQLNSKNDPRSFLEGYNSIKSLEYVRPKKY